MNVIQPPRFATWMLQRFAVKESIIGDLIEGYQAKRSTTWYWRQVVMAIGGATWRDVSARELAPAAAVLAGWGALLAVFGMSSFFAPDRLGFWIVWLNVGPSAVVIWTPWWESVLDPRVVGLGCLGFSMSGWLVARLRPSAMLAFMVTVSAWGLSSAAVVLFGPAWHGLVWFAPYGMATSVFHSTAYLLLVAVTLPFLVFVGGLVGLSPQGAATRMNPLERK